MIIKAENVSIRYMTGDFKDIGLKEYVVKKLTGKYDAKEFFAVNNISFELEKGDMLGIVGSNGSGKSTLLKAISGIMEPSKGKITCSGRISAILELGSGCDPDLTIRENAYLMGAMLGYTRKFMDSKYDEIIAFAELEDFQDRFFRQLSSGMKARLAFSIASLVNPDILILDEVLSVGDGAFRKKSANKMREIINSGVTTIYVSHSLDEIRSLCNKVLWIDKGKQVAFGDTAEICDWYQTALDTKGNLAYKIKKLDANEFAAAYSNNMRDYYPQKIKPVEFITALMNKGEYEAYGLYNKNICEALIGFVTKSGWYLADYMHCGKIMDSGVTLKYFFNEVISQIPDSSRILFETESPENDRDENLRHADIEFCYMLQNCGANRTFVSANIEDKRYDLMCFENGSKPDADTIEKNYRALCCIVCGDNGNIPDIVTQDFMV